MVKLAKYTDLSTRNEGYRPVGYNEPKTLEGN